MNNNDNKKMIYNRSNGFTKNCQKDIQKCNERGLFKVSVNEISMYC